MNTVYSNIKAIRIKKNLSQSEMGKKIGTNQSNYNRIEAGLTQLTIERMEQIAKVFEMSVNELMNYEGKEVVNSEILEYINKIDELNKKITKNAEKYEKERAEAEDLDDYISNKHNEEVEKLKKAIKDRDEKLKKKDELLKEKDERLKEKEERLIEKDERIKDKMAIIEALQNVIGLTKNGNN